MERMHEKKNTSFKTYGKVIGVMYLITAGLLVVLTIITGNVKAQETVSTIGVLCIYLISSLAGGILIGKIKKERRFMWGFLMGLAYYLILLIISATLMGGETPDYIHMLTTFVICVAGGCVGGMIS